LPLLATLYALTASSLAFDPALAARLPSGYLEASAMLPFRRILFPVDCSESCQAAVPYVREMQRRFESGLSLLHAVDQAGTMFAGFQPSPGLPEIARIREAEEERLAEFAEISFPGVNPSLIVKEGDPATAIRDVVRHEGTDLVMMPSHGAGPFRRFLIGSVTAKVLHDLSCPVWTGSHLTEEYAPVVPYKSILCVVNTGEEAMPLMQAAGALATSYKARLSIVHVLGTPPAVWEFDYGPYRKALLASADAQLGQARRELHLDATTEVLEGEVATTVRQYATENRIDLVVTGRGHYQGLFGRLWSHLYAIVRESPCPVISF
jgi:nucleotide-binding universal stress UspA family protein